MGKGWLGTDAWWDKQQAKPKKQRNTRKLVCSNCRSVQSVTRTELRHAARQRCSKCGGPLNRPSLA